jgi:MoaA/NifB/PqqE/SkfB family radical SAM enzyme
MATGKLKVETRTKGYQKSISVDWDPNGAILTRLLGFTDNKINSIARNEDKKELIKIRNMSHELITGKRKPSNESFLPKGFEEQEAIGLNKKDFLTYVAYRYRYNTYPITKTLSDYPPCVQIEPTSMCNFRCVMCYQIDKSFSGKSHGHMGMMDLNVYKKAIDELEGNVQALTLASRGEPLMNPDIEEMISYTGNKFLGFKLNTNASLLTEKRCHILLQSGLKTLVFSADAADKDTYEKIRINGKFEKVYQNIKRFSEIKAKQYPKSKIITKVSGVNISQEGQNFDEMTNIWGDLVDDVAFVYYNPWESAYDNEENTLIAPCSDLWRRMFLWQDGRVNPCDYDYKSTIFFGSQPTFGKNSLKEIWHSDVYKKLREKHLTKSRSKIEPCKRCVAI